MKKIHEYLKKKYSQYALWDKNPRHNIYHWVLFISLTFLVWALSSNHIKTQYTIVDAQSSLNLQSVPQSTSFLDTFDGTPTKPEPFTQTVQQRWDIQIHSRDGYPTFADYTKLPSMNAHHGIDCGAPGTYDANGKLTGLVTHPISETQDYVFKCNGHIMTSLSSSGYSLIYLTPNHMVDFTNGEAVIRWDMTTFRSSGRDWMDVWVTPWEDEIALPLYNDFPDLNGVPKRAINIQMQINKENVICPEVFVNFVGVADVTQPYKCRFIGYDTVLTPDPKRRDTFEVRIKKDHIKVWMPAYNLVWFDNDVPTMDWSSGIVQFGHHSYSPDKDPASSFAAPSYNNTWHWDNISISPSVPFTIIKPDKRFVEGEKPTTHTITFQSPAPSGSRLRFSGLGINVQASFNNGATWQDVPYGNPNENSSECCHAHSFKLDNIPVGSQTVLLRGDSQFTKGFLAKDIAIFAKNSSIPLPTSTLTPTSTPVPQIPSVTLTLAPSLTPTPTRIPTFTLAPTQPIQLTNTPTPPLSGNLLKLGYTKVGSLVDSSNSNYMNSTRFAMGAQNGLVSTASVYVGTVDTTPNNQFEIAIYTNNNGVPGTLVAKSTRGTLKANSWNTVNITASLKAKTAYWIAYNSNGRSTSVNNMHFNSTNNLGKTAWSTNGQLFGVWPTTFGSATKQGAIFSIYVTYTPI